MKKFLLISPKNRTVYNFRGDLIREIQKRDYDVWVTGPNTMGIAEVEALGVHFVEIPMNKNGINPLADIRYAWKLWKLLRKVRPDVTLGYTIKPVIYGAIAARIAGVDNICSMVTGAGYLFSAKTLKAKCLRIIGGMLYKMGFACARCVIFQNPDDLNEFTSAHLVNSKKCHVVNGSGVNMGHFTLAPLPGQLTFFMLSRALFSKGVREYLHAARLVKQQHPEVRFMYLGAVEHMPDALTEEEVQSYVDDGTIEHFGETSDVRRYTAQCSVFVLPSYREGTPRTVLEAMAMGRAIITTDTPGCRETVREGINGFLVPVKDVKSLADRMSWFISHPTAVESMGKASHEYCAEKFDVRKVNEMMLEICQIGK